MSKSDGGRPLVAMVGNPNVGKTTLFNRLTRSRQRVGNFPGVTVDAATGRLTGNDDVIVVDLPGTYSLAAVSPDEQVVVDAVTGALARWPAPDLVVCVLDAANLRRHLFLAAQIADLGLPLLLAVNLIDDAERSGLHLDLALLSARLGVPVVACQATTGRGVDELIAAIRKGLVERPMMRAIEWPEAVESATSQLHRQIHAACGQSLQRPRVRRVLFDSAGQAASRLPWAADACNAALTDARQVVAQSGFHPLAAESVLTYRFVDELLLDVGGSGSELKAQLTERFDRIALHRVWGLLIFAAIMFIVFQSVYTWAGPLMDLMDAGTAALQSVLSGPLSGTPILHDLIIDGIVGGIGSVIIFLPQICVLFLFLALLEDSGYMARAAFLMDRLFSWCGLNGKSFIPLMSSFACAVPGVMASRTIGDSKARLTTILIAPLMSCSARLPVYVLLIGAFVDPHYGPVCAGALLFLMHFVGLALAVPVAWVINRMVLRTPATPFLLELPSYRCPNPSDVVRRVFEKGRTFVVSAGTVILAMAIVVWFLLYFPRPSDVAVAAAAEVNSELAAAGETPTAAALEARVQQRTAGLYLEQSLLARFGKTIQPVFAPAGYDWKITVGVLASFPARELIIATLGIIYNLGDEIDEDSPDLRSALAAEVWPGGKLAGTPVFTVPVALSIMVFFALCMQCMATLATIARETNWRWAAATFLYMTTLAWVAAVATYQIGTLVLS